jgi:dephospho-CoA kinase
MSAEEVLKRVDSQMDRAERLARAHVLVDNSGDVSDLERTVGSLWDIRVKGRMTRK